MEIEFKASAYTVKGDLYDISVLPSCNILVTDRWNKSVKVFDVRNGRLLSNVQLPGEPWRVCLLPGDRAAVLLPDWGVTLIQILDVSTDQPKLLDSVNVKGWCSGLAYINYKFIVYLSDEKCLASINVAGKRLKSVSNDYSGNQLLSLTQYICVATANTVPSVYVADSTIITQLSEELQVLRTFRPRAHYWPHGLAAVGGGQLIVTGIILGKPTLLVLNTITGKFTELLSKDPDDEDWWYGLNVAFCPRLGRVYVNVRTYCKVDLIAVYEIA